MHAHKPATLSSMPPITQHRRRLPKTTTHHVRSTSTPKKRTPSKPKPESEAQFQARILDLAKIYGWWVYHVRDSRKATCKGFPDLTLFHPEKSLLFYRELKTQKGRVKPEQVIWLEGMNAAGADAKIWRPGDWEEILHVLSFGAFPL